MLFIVAKALLASLLTAIFVAAHPGEHHNHEDVAHFLEKRGLHAAHVARGLDACALHPSYINLQERAIERRAAKAESLRRRSLETSYKRKLHRRDLSALEADEKLSYNKTNKKHTYQDSTKPAALFKSYKNSSCILTPEVTDGPYYVEGEYIRSNVVDGQEGVPVHLEYQYIDISTCDAAKGLYVDTWQANATGVYSGVVASGNGNFEDATNINKTFLRGMQPTNKEGVVAFDTIFAGHYAGRATHIHLIAHQNGTVLKNKTYSSGTVSHVGQLFFPMSLRNAVEATYPYNENTQTVVTNDEDMWAPDQADNDYDPFPSYAYLTDDITDGLLMWIVVGIDLSADYNSDVNSAATLTANGGVSDSNNNTNGTGPGGSMSGSAPSGSAGSGVPTGSPPGTSSSSVTTTKTSSKTKTTKTSSTKKSTTTA